MLDPKIEDAFVQFAARLKATLAESFSFAEVLAETMKRVQAAIDSEFLQAKRIGLVLQPCAGLEVIGGEVVLVQESLNLRWKTAFFPAPRYNVYEDGLIPLGFFEKYDLYLAYQADFPPTLIARYGNQPCEYGSLNPYLVGIENVLDHPIFKHALNRANFLDSKINWKGTFTPV